VAQTQIPSPISTEKGQRSVQAPFMVRWLPAWQTPTWFTGQSWRNAVRHQPIAMVCRDTIIANLVSSPWQIVSKNQAVDVSSEEIRYYTDKIENLDGGFDIHIDLVMQDALDLPFGGASEVGRENDDPEGKLMWALHMDGATLFPTYNSDWPAGQLVPDVSPLLPVYFPKHAISRTYYSPRPEINRKGWGMAPPEKIYLALELLSRGDRYYANLLLDTPETGVLDLGDISSETAEEWLKSWRELLVGIDSLKVPILYEHTSPAKFIPFGRSPIELAYSNTTLRYMQIITAGYGLSLADIGIIEGDVGSLAGAIRQERRSLRTGIGEARRKVSAYVTRMLPEYLMHAWVERDDEILAAKGRARLANSMAMSNLTGGKQILTPEDAQQQLIADGLLTVSITPVSEFEPEPKSEIVNPLLLPPHPVANEMQKPVPASSGGEGEINARAMFVVDSNESRFRRLSNIVRRNISTFIEKAQSALDKDEVPLFHAELSKFLNHEPSEFDALDLPVAVRSSTKDALRKDLAVDGWWKVDLSSDRLNAIPFYQRAKLEATIAMADVLYESGNKVDRAGMLEMSDIVGAEIDKIGAYLETKTADVHRSTVELLVGCALRAAADTMLDDSMPIVMRGLFTEGFKELAKTTQTDVVDQIYSTIVENLTRENRNGATNK